MIRTLAPLLALAALATSACDLDSISQGVPARCAESGAQCALEGGPLGVCERAPCADGATPPCFQCTPQH